MNNLHLANDIATNSSNPVVKILLVIPNLGPGGAQAVFRYQLSMLSADFDVKACVFNTDGFLPVDATLNVHSLGIPKGSNLISKIWNFCRRIIQLRRLKKELMVDLTISHLEGADYVNILSGVASTICWIHGSKKFDENISGAIGFIRHRILMPWLYRRTNQIVTVSKGIAHEIREYIGDAPIRIVTIYNSLDVDRLRFEAAEEVPPEYERLVASNKVITVHCRLTRQKNIESLLTIFKSVVSTRPSKLVVVGDGEERTELLNISRNLSLRTWSVWEGKYLTSDFDVYFLGFHSNAVRFVARASAFVMTSSWEGFPLALCEAILVGVTVIAADCPTGPREILLPESNAEGSVQVPTGSPFGILMPVVTVGDTEIVNMWTKSIVEVLDYGLQTPEAPIDKLSDTLNFDSNKTATCEVIDNAIARRNPRYEAKAP